MRVLLCSWSLPFVVLSIACSSTSSDPVVEPAVDAATQGTPEAASGEDAAQGTAEAASGEDAGQAEASAPAPTCVPEGTPNNELGLGGYCASSAACASDAGLRLCTADFGIAAKFCTTPCETDSNCGSGMYCAQSAQGSGCTPLACRAPSAE